MRSLFLIALAAASVSTFAETATLVGTFGKTEVGTGTFTITPQRDRTMTENTVFKIALNGQKIEVQSTVHISQEGMTLRADQKEVVNGAVQKDVSIQYTLKAAIVTNKATGEKKTYPIPVGAKTTDPSGLWFVTSKPKIGAKSVATAFSVDLFAWRKTVRVYVGDQPFTLDGKKIVGHQLKDDSDGHTVLALVDDHGLPLDLDLAGFHFTRK